MKRCRNCHYECETLSEVFCPNCGSELDKVEVEYEESAAGVHVVQKSSRYKGKGLVFGILLLLLVVNAFIWFGLPQFLTDKQQGKSQSGQSTFVWNQPSQSNGSGSTNNQQGTNNSGSTNNQQGSGDSATTDNQASVGQESQPSLKKVTLSPNTSQTTGQSETASTVSNDSIRQLFSNYFGGLRGEHALFFQQLTNSKGEKVHSQPLVIERGAIRSASTIKLWMLAALFDQIHQGKLTLNRQHTVSSGDIVGGTGIIQNAGAGSVYTLEGLAKLMMTHSDNTAMNILVDYVGFDVVNEFIRQQGFSQTRLQRKMLDEAAIRQGRDNYISAGETGLLLQKMYHRQLLSPEFDTQMMNILGEQTDKEHLEALLPATVRSYNKTGKFSTYGIRNDVAIIETPKGAFSLIVLSQDGNEASQIDAMQRFGLAVYQTFINQAQ